MGEIVVKHFKRSSNGSESKVLVTEIVVENSDTGRFLHHLEETRLTRPCYQTIDMRGRVAGECRPYAFNDRVHYFDDISFQMFEQGLKENHGVYTVGMFEAIISGPHTIRAQEHARQEAHRRREAIERRRLERAQAAALERAGATGKVEAVSERDLGAEFVANPDCLPLAYFRKREYPRLQFACHVELGRGNIKTNATTRDISVSGLQVRVKGLTTFKAGQEVKVSFGDLPVETGKTSLNRVIYRVVRSEVREEETALSLVRPNCEQPRGLTEIIETLVENYQRKYKLDVEDEYQSILSWYYERCYAQNASCIPFFVEKSDDQGLRVQAVAMSEGNAHMAKFFCTDADNYNFTPICLPARLQRLEQQKSFLLAMYRQRGAGDQCMRIHSAADFEFSSTEMFLRFLRHSLSQSEYSVVKVQVSQVPASQVPERKLEEVAQRLQYKSEEKMLELRECLERLHLVGYMVDVTQSFSGLLSGYSNDEIDNSDIAAWVGTERRSVTDQKVLEKLSLQPEVLRPELVRFGYVERRREDRYLAETSVVVKTGAVSCDGISRDISTLGMRVQCDKVIDARRGATVKVGLVSLQQKKSSTNLMDISYRVVNARETEEGTLLMLERILGHAQEGLKEFFVELISRNQHKLGVDIGDIWGAASSRVYESLLSANMPTLPLFLACNAEGGAHLQYVGVPEAGSALLDFFRVSDGFDFCCLNERRVIRALYDAVQILSRQGKNSEQRPTPFEIDFYLYKEHDALTGETFIHTATELDFPDPDAHRAFLHKLPEYDDWRYLRIVATYVDGLDEKIFNKMVDSVRAQSRHRFIKLEELARSLVGYGELIDITEEWLALRALGVVD